ncbi:hypothetical protein [Photobacterium profundum]|uniref:Bacteriophage lambda Replication protein O N-terminal domain-containing protein n=1 Tax=Photobacterium profundum (strain SS9) TaxID=298386 RepID=Q6LJU4_PHOPR|nr:hypothetical protein [Photobacterium profundum]CAG22436.1 hypothetical protein PBPRB0563 [Photobacterium profundum SS9]
MSGWVKIHRSLREHFLYSFDEPDKSLAWIDLLLSASYEDSKVMVKGRVVCVSRGQFFTSQSALQKRWGMSQNKVKRFLRMLEAEQMVIVEANVLYTIITICNYSDFQDSDQVGERTANVLRTYCISENTENDKKTDVLADVQDLDASDCNDYSFEGSVCKGERTDERTDERTANEQANDIKRSKEEQEKEKEAGRSAKPPEISFKFSDDDLLLAGYMFEKIIEIFPDEKKPNLEQWAEHIRLTRERDKRTHKEILKLFTWCNEHSFHAQNVRSPKKLRDKWADLSAGQISEDWIHG